MTIFPMSLSVAQTSRPSGLTAKFGENLLGIGMRRTTECCATSITAISAVRAEFTNAYRQSGRKITMATPSEVVMRRVSRITTGSITDT